MPKPKIKTFLNWTAEDIARLSAVTELDVQEALLFAKEAKGEAEAMLKARVTQEVDIFRQSPQE